MSAQNAEIEATTRTEYALVRDVGHGLIVASGPHSANRWNEHITLEQAAEAWYPGSVVMSRTVTTFEPVVTEWKPLNRPAQPGPTA